MMLRWRREKWRKKRIYLSLMQLHKNTRGYLLDCVGWMPACLTSSFQVTTTKDAAFPLLQVVASVLGNQQQQQQQQQQAGKEAHPSVFIAYREFCLRSVTIKSPPEEHKLRKRTDMSEMSMRNVPLLHNFIQCLLWATLLNGGHYCCRGSDVTSSSTGLTDGSLPSSGQAIPQDSWRSMQEREIGESEEMHLYRTLMRHYDRDVRPTRNSSHPVVVRIGITLTQIFDLDEKNQVLTTNVWLDMEWTDEFLMWNPDENGGLKTIRLPCERIWLPDIVLYNNADDYTQGLMNSKAMISSDGNVFWPPPTKMRSKCPVDVTYFPFDHQICTLKLGSWIYDGFQVDVTNRTTEVDMSNYVPNGEWELLVTRIQRNVKYYPCCPEPFPDVTITIAMRRRTLYYVSNVVLPCMMMSALTLLVFRLPPDAGEKIALGFTVLLAFSVFMLTVAEKMPETSTSVPLIGMYLTVVMALTTLSIIMTVVVLNFHYRGPSKKKAPVWFRKLLLTKIGSVLCSDALGDPSPSRSDRMRRCNNDAELNRKSMMSHPFARRRRYQYSDVSEDNFVREHLGGGGSCPVAQPADRSDADELSTLLKLRTSSAVAAAALMHPVTCCGQQPEVLDILRYVVERENRDAEEADVVNEWRQMAVVFDRILFWLFLVAIIVCSIVFLLVVPFHGDNRIKPGTAA